MKRLFVVILAAALLLAGCGGPEPAAEAEAPLSVSMEAAPVMGRSYVPAAALPQEITPMAEGGGLKDTVWRAAESADGRAALYALDSGGAVLVEWDGALAMFEGWQFQSPQCVQPWMAVMDAGGTDAADTLAICLFLGGGTGISVEALHILTRDGRGAMTDYALPEALYRKELAGLMTAEVGGRRGTVSLGNVTLALPEPGQKYTGGISLGNIVSYEAGRTGRLSLTLAIGMEMEGTAVPSYVGELLSDVEFDGSTGTYTLSGFALRDA